MNRLLMPCSFAVTLAVQPSWSACDGEHSETPYAAGALTVFDRSSNAYSFPAPTLSELELARHRAGDAAFEARFVTAPAPVHAGLGPVFNHTSCAGCHPRDGRGLALVGGPPLLSPLLVRVSLAGADAHGGPLEVPGLGTQIQDHATFGVEAEAEVELTWHEVPGVYGDGTAFTLRRPEVTLWGPGGELGPEILRSARIAPPTFGLGLLEAVPDATLMALADPGDEDGDGISGRVNLVWDPRVETHRVGRFGWKANTVDLTLQVAGAYAADMGVSSPLHPESDGSFEVPRSLVDDNTFYVRTLGVPASVTDELPGASRGQRLFMAFGCASCHVESLETGPHTLEVLSGHRIAAYTNLLLHDMGEGLADGRPDWSASGSEWRTAPLWGIGLAQTVLPGAGYLHDGRARTLEEAILWHGGEAEDSRERFRNAASADRADLVAFLRSL